MPETVIRKISRECLEALRLSHEFEAAIWDKWIRTGEAQLIDP